MWSLANFKSPGSCDIRVSTALEAQEIYDFCPWRIEEHLKEKVIFEPTRYGLYVVHGLVVGNSML